MNRIFLCLAAAAVLLLTGCPREPKSKEIVEFERTWLKDYVEQNHRRVNGVLLDATAELKGDDVLIHWSLDYDGPRPPLTILKPMYPSARGEVEVRLIVPDPNKVQLVTVHPPGNWIPPGALPLPGPNAYITVERGQTAKGTTVVPLQHIKKRLVAEVTMDHPGQLPRELYVVLIHSPTSRGMEHYLDGWTIDWLSREALFSVPRRVVVKEWPEDEP